MHKIIKHRKPKLKKHVNTEIKQENRLKHNQNEEMKRKSFELNNSNKKFFKLDFTIPLSQSINNQI